MTDLERLVRKAGIVVPVALIVGFAGAIAVGVGIGIWLAG
jgi:hypothetical protein